MRRFVHKTIGVGVPSIGAIVTGVAALGGEPVRESIWNVIIAVWHDPVSLSLCVAVGAALLVIWIWTGLSGQEAASNVHQTHTGSGHNINATTVNFEKPAFLMTDHVMAGVLRDLGKPRQISLNAVGGQESEESARTLAKFLQDKGFIVTLNWIGVMCPQLERPIELRSGELFVDTSK